MQFIYLYFQIYRFLSKFYNINLKFMFVYLNFSYIIYMYVFILITIIYCRIIELLKYSF